MTYREIFTEIYKNNKRFIILCITMCLVFSMLCYGGTFAVNADDMSGTEIAVSFGGSFGKVVAPIIGFGYIGGIDTSWTMVILSATSLLAKAGHNVGIRQLEFLDGFSYGVFENTFISIFLLAWFGLPLLAKAMGKTQVLGIAIENMTKLNGVLIGFISMSMMISNTNTMMKVRAASGAASLVKGGISFIACFLVLVVTLIIYFLVRYLFAFIDILMIPVCTFVPFASVFMVIMKFAAICLMILMAKYAPWMFFVVAAIVILISAIMFRTAYRALRYFKNIYARPLFRRIFKGFDRNIPLIAPKVPGAISEYLNGRSIQMLIPVYLLTPIPNVKAMHKWERWWMVSECGQTYLVKKNRFDKECIRIPLIHTPAQKMFINQFITYHEVFNIYGSEENIVKKIKRVPKYSHFVFSKEYSFRYGEILELTGFVDYKQYKDYLTNMAQGNFRQIPR